MYALLHPAFTAGETTSPQDKLNGAKRYFRTNQEFNKQLNLTSSYKRLSSFPIRTFIGRVAQDLPYLNIRLAPTASYNGLASIKLGRNDNWGYMTRSFNLRAPCVRGQSRN